MHKKSMTVQKFLRLQSFFRGIIFAAMEKGKQMAKEYIPKNDLEQALIKEAAHLLRYYKRYMSVSDVVEELIGVVRRFPAADVTEVRYERWEEHGCKWQGTDCKVLMKLDGTPQENSIYYCPNCGAKIDEEATDA